MAFPAKPLSVQIDLAAEIADIDALVAAKSRSAADPERLFAAVSKKIKGQDLAVKTSLDVICSGLARVNRKRPIASVIMVGPPGVGKSESCEQISNALYSDRPEVIECATLKTPEEAKNILFGAAPMYANADKGGRVVNRLQAKKNGTVIVLDELEKAHKEVPTLLLSALNEGEVTDNFHGRRITCANAVFLFTTNERWEDCVLACSGLSDPQEIHTACKNVIAQSGRLDSAFLDRISRVVCYLPLSRQALAEFALDAINNLAKELGIAVKTIGRGVIAQIVADVVSRENRAANPRQIALAVDTKLNLPMQAAQRNGVATVDVAIEDGEFRITKSA